MTKPRETSDQQSVVPTFVRIAPRVSGALYDLIAPVGKHLARLLHLPPDMAIFCWQIAGIFLMLLSCRNLLAVCFESPAARWGGLLLLTV